MANSFESLYADIMNTGVEATPTPTPMATPISQLGTTTYVDPTTLIETGVKEKLTVRQMIQRGMSYNEIAGKLPKDLRGMFTKDKYDQAVKEMKAQKGK